MTRSRLVATAKLVCIGPLTIAVLSITTSSPAIAANKAKKPTTTKPTITKPSTTKPSKAVDPNAPEVVAPGDIPDNQVFVPYQPPAGGYTISVPEGWSRTENAGVVTFTDKFNAIQITTTPAASAPTVDSVKSSGLIDVEKDPTFKLGKVSAVKTVGGPAIRATYEIGSTPNKVTGKKALLAVERYVYFGNAHQVVVTLSGAKGADNVDPWRIVSDSVRVK